MNNSAKTSKSVLGIVTDCDMSFDVARETLKLPEFELAQLRLSQLNDSVAHDGLAAICVALSADIANATLVEALQLFTLKMGDSVWWIDGRPLDVRTKYPLVELGGRSRYTIEGAVDAKQSWSRMQSALMSQMATIKSTDDLNANENEEADRDLEEACRAKPWHKHVCDYITVHLPAKESAVFDFLVDIRNRIQLNDNRPTQEPGVWLHLVAFAADWINQSKVAIPEEWLMREVSIELDKFPEIQAPVGVYLTVLLSLMIGNDAKFTSEMIRVENGTLAVSVPGKLDPAVFVGSHDDGKFRPWENFAHGNSFFSIHSNQGSDAPPFVKAIFKTAPPLANAND